MDWFERRVNRRAFVGRGLAVAAAWMLAACTGKSSSTATSAPRTATATTIAPTVASTSSPSPSPTASSQVPTPACVVRPQQTEWPYFVDEKLNRSDIRSDPSGGSVKDGVPLNLLFRVAKLTGAACTALAGATMDVWHCDALGVYSDATDPSFNTKGKKFLRGYQATDANGNASFTTIYPGWYQGRAVHIHFKIRTTSGYSFTSQLYFDDSITDQVHAQAPYSSKGQGRLRNSSDGIFRDGGSQLLLAPAKTANGYTATFDIGLRM
ncbi:MAG: intradiol ring-cleavage dioxygenase [Chloroflexi bacterium]|nr:intradiol ring-cleavage dioxygenase [Chloroflexota bacterium]